MIDAIQLFNNAVYPGGQITIHNAWLGVYQVLLWYEPIGIAGITALPHIIDADKLRPSVYRHSQRGAAGTPTSANLSAWQRRAVAVEDYMAQQLGVAPNQVAETVDLLLKKPGYIGLQRQNTLGTAFIGLVKHVLETFGNQHLTYRTEVDATTVFPGITMPGRSATPSIDILVEKNSQPRSIISAKWSLRHDRINDITNECPIYKAAAMRARLPLDYFVVTNEFDPARLHKVLSDTCLEGLVHIHEYNVTNVCQMNGRLSGVLGLPDLIALTHGW